MTMALLFWLLMVLWLVGYTWVGWPRDPATRPLFASSMLLWVLLALLGWGVFGSPIKG